MGAAIVREGRVLAARRTAPPETAGRWELPGGKVEPGETPEEALVREVAEELGCGIRVAGWLPGSARIGDTHELTVAVAVLLDARRPRTPPSTTRCAGWARASWATSTGWSPTGPSWPTWRDG